MIGVVSGLRAAVTLSEATFVVLWEKLGFGDLPRALFMPSPGATTGERARVEQLAAVELSRLGFGGGAALDHELVATLRVLAAPVSECYGWLVPARGRPFSVFAAASAEGAVLATLTAPAVELRPIRPEHLVEVVANQLPAHPPGPTSVRTDHSLAAFELAALDTVVGNGQLFLAVRDKRGRRQYPWMIEYVDTTQGRRLLRRGTTTVAEPASTATIAAELDLAHRALRESLGAQ
jgi:hypothetical protein